MKILVAEDNAQSLYLLEQYFTGRGHEVWSAHNGREALDLCRLRGVPDAIISDALMPLLDGFELCDAVRRDPALAGLPYILYTATYTADSDERFARSIGVDRFVVKPIEPNRLLAITEEVTAQVRKAPPRAPQPAEPRAELVQEYARLVSVKLEDKVAELSRTNAALRTSEDSVRQLNERLLATVRRLEAEIDERRRTAELLRLAQHVGGIGHWECDGAGTLQWSDEASQLLGCPPGLGPATLSDFVRGVVADDRPRAEAALLNDGKPGTSIDLEIRYATAGAPRHLLLRAGDPPSPAQAHAHRIGIIQDISARKEAEARRQLLEQQLFRSQKMEALGKLAGGIAHDFNNILTAILGHAELLKIELGPGAAGAASLAEIAHAGQRAREIITQILTFSRRQTVEKRTVRLAGTVEEALRLVRSTIPKHIAVRSILGSDRNVTVNENQIQQVLLNLCTNAAHAMAPNGGTITVMLASVDFTAVEAAVRPGFRPGAYVRLDVSDTGAGMKPEVLEHLFEPFFTTKPAGEGTGLGLSVVHGIVQAHEGMITVESELSRGTTFSLFFPAASGLEEKQERQRTMNLPSGHGERVLVVDDEPSVARTCAQLLDRLGYCPTAVTDPTEARELFDREPDAFALVVSDFLMPRLTGLDLARALWSRKPGLPVILVAGFGAQMDATRAREAGFCAFLAKPFTLATLGEAVARALARRPVPHA